MEDGRALPGGLRPRFYDLEPAVVYATLSVQDLVEARRFFVDAIGLAEERDLVLHGPDDESSWGLAGARSEAIVLRAADVFLELVCYEDPTGRPHPDGYLLSDQGFMNIALGFRDQQPLDEVFARLTTSGYLANRERPQSVGGTYVNDGQGNTTELLLCPREMDDSFGFEPRTPLYRPLSWQRARVPPAEAARS